MNKLLSDVVVYGVREIEIPGGCWHIEVTAKVPQLPVMTFVVTLEISEENDVPVFFFPFDLSLAASARQHIEKMILVLLAPRVPLVERILFEQNLRDSGAHWQPLHPRTAGHVEYGEFAFCPALGVPRFSMRVKIRQCADGSRVVEMPIGVASCFDTDLLKRTIMRARDQYWNMQARSVEAKQRHHELQEDSERLVS